MKGDEFNIILSNLKASDEETWLSIQSHIGVILSNWAKREKIELDWVASAEGIGSAGSVEKEVYSRFREGLLSGLLKADSYSDYKRAVFMFCLEILEDQYARFHQLLTTGNNAAWQRVYERLYIYTAKWLSERKIEGEVARDIYQDSMLTFFKKITSKELHFETSREYKSYYFRILELKTMEDRRQRIRHRQRWAESESIPLFGTMQEDGYEADDQYLRIEKIIGNSISGDEEFILRQYYFQGEKLSEIAKALHISDGNCRQKKLQVLRKIAVIYHQTEPIKHEPQ